MNTSPVTITSYLPPVKRERSKLQQLKDKHRSFTETSKEGIPKDLNELKLIKYRDHGITFLNEYLNINKKVSKSQYCKTNHISHNTLNTGLIQLGYKTRIKQANLEAFKHKKTNLDQTRLIETNQDQSRPINTKGKLNKKKEQIVKGGEPYNFEETFNKTIDSFSDNKCL
jgi:hypothetical protein